MQLCISIVISVPKRRTDSKEPATTFINIRALLFTEQIKHHNNFAMLLTISWYDNVFILYFFYCYYFYSMLYYITIITGKGC